MENQDGWCNQNVLVAYWVKQREEGGIFVYTPLDLSCIPPSESWPLALHSHPLAVTYSQCLRPLKSQLPWHYTYLGP